jgi:predicted RNase H-like HicB family nuclease
MKNYKFTVVIEKDEDGKFLAVVPSLQGCYTEGDTIEEAGRLIEDAIKLHIEDRIENGEPIYEEVATKEVNIVA